MDSRNLLSLAASEYLSDKHPEWTIGSSLTLGCAYDMVSTHGSDIIIFINTDAQELELFMIINGEFRFVDSMKYTDATILHGLSYYINNYNTYDVVQ